MRETVPSMSVVKAEDHDSGVSGMARAETLETMMSRWP